jgi:hypothetical protein
MSDMNLGELSILDLDDSDLDSDTGRGTGHVKTSDINLGELSILDLDESDLDTSWEDIVSQKSLLDVQQSQSSTAMTATPTTPTKAGPIVGRSVNITDMVIVPASGSTTGSTSSSSEIVTPPRHSIAHRRFLPTLLPVSNSEDCSWEDVEDDLAITLENNPDSLQLFRSVHSAGVCERHVLQSLAYLSSSTLSPLQSPVKVTNDVDHAPFDATHECRYTDAVSTVADYLAQQQSTTDQTIKLACLRLLMTLRSPIEAGWQLQESVLANTVLFVTERSYEWEYLDHSDQVLLWELRAICLNEQERMVEQLGRIRRRGEFTATSISAGARFVEAGLLHSTNMVTSGMDETGGLLKTVLEPKYIEPAISNSNTHHAQKKSSGMATLVVTGAAKRVTNDARVTTKGLVMELRKVSTQGLQTAATKFQDGNMGERLVPHPESRMVLMAVGDVGMASLGAAAIVGEAVYNSTSAVVKKTADITVDVIEHKFGHSAGQVVRDTSDTAGNVLRTIASVAAFKGRILTKAIAKDVGKNHVQEYENKGSTSLLDESMECDELAEEQIEVQLDTSELEGSEVSVGVVDIRTIYLSGSSVGSKRGVSNGDDDDEKHGDNIAAGHETDETESVTVCGDEVDSRIPDACPPLKLEALSRYGGGLQIHTGN